MPKKPSPHRVKRHREYTPFEAAEALDLHRQTVIRWIRHHGLVADTSAKPWLIRGADLKAFLAERRQAGRTRLAVGEIYCLPCRKAQIPAERMAEFQLQTGSGGQLSGICPDCARMMYRRTRRSELEAIRAVLDVTVRQPVARIVGATPPSVTATRTATRRSHG